VKNWLRGVGREEQGSGDRIFEGRCYFRLEPVG
jgi:hypothetical protein